MENNIPEIYKRLQEIVGELMHGGVTITENTEFEIIDTISTELITSILPVDISEGQFEELKKAMRNMFVLGQLSPTE